MEASGCAARGSSMIWWNSPTRCGRRWSRRESPAETTVRQPAWSPAQSLTCEKTRAEKPGAIPSTSFEVTLACARTSRSEEHTSELQSRLHLVCRLLLEKKKKKEMLDERQT